MPDAWLEPESGRIFARYQCHLVAAADELVDELVAQHAPVVERGRSREIATGEMTLDRARSWSKALTGQDAHLMAADGACARRARLQRNRPEPPRDEPDQVQELVTPSPARLFNAVIRKCD